MFRNVFKSIFKSSLTYKIAYGSKLTTLIRPRSSQIRLNHGAPSLSPSLIHNLFPTCNSCGIKVQTDDPNKPGYYLNGTNGNPDTVNKRKSEDEKFDKYLSSLPLEDQKLLLNDANSNLPSFKDSSTQFKKQEKEERGSKIQCLRCRKATHQSNFNNLAEQDYPIEPFDSIMNEIPPNGNLVYIVSAQDFPMSFNDEVFKYRNAKEIQILVTKNDLLFKTIQLSNKYGLTFYRDYFWRNFKVPPENVNMVSGLIDWNIKHIIKLLKNDSYLIGHVNSGKSTIIQSLLYIIELEMREKLKRQPNSKLKTKFEKIQDRNINSLKSIGKTKLNKLNEEKILKFKKLNGPGTSYMPGFTRGHIPYELNDHLTVHDVPGFTNNKNHGIYEIMTPQDVKVLSKGVKIYERGSYKSHYETIRGDQVLTIGGIFLLKAPGVDSSTMLQVRNCINFGIEKFSNLDKVKNVFANIESYPSIKNKLIVNDLKYERFIIPPFHGSVDIVIKNIGHINILATGSKLPNDEPLLIYLPKNVDAIIRQPITKYTTRTLAGRDNKGNPLKKENLVSKSVTHVVRYTGGPFYSKLIPTKHKSPSLTDKEFSQHYIKNIKGSFDEVDEINNWIEL